MIFVKRFCLLLTFLLAGLVCQRVSAQESSGQVDSLVSLLSAKSLRQVEENGIQYRKVIGPARFFHNNTYLICDTAYWYLNTEIIDALGNVKILQNETVLTGDSLRYIVNEDLAQFRGHLVQLEDKDHNVLRTRHLDYNTKDSVAVFNFGDQARDYTFDLAGKLDGDELYARELWRGAEGKLDGTVLTGTVPAKDAAVYQIAPLAYDVIEEESAQTEIPTEEIPDRPETVEEKTTAHTVPILIGVGIAAVVGIAAGIFIGKTRTGRKQK